ncbi:hypothetical protein BN975_00061 [Mycolicibacterium farcinogenes]|nr:hypothetical protein BN975_00061 [Mycolicibacterium farcinogenes]
MSGSGPFGFDPEDFDRVAREAGEGLRDALDGLSKFITRPGQAGGWAGLIDEFARFSQPRTEPETTGEKGDGVWAIYTVDDAGAPTSSRCTRTNSRPCGPTRATRIRAAGCGSCPTASRSACSIQIPASNNDSNC